MASLSLVAFAACGEVQQGQPDAGGADGPGEPPPISLELLAGDIGGSGSLDGTRDGARFRVPNAIAVDGAGNAYVTDHGNHTIRKITGAGVVTTFAGAPGLSGSADGTAAAARFNEPHSVAIDSAGNLYVTDGGNATIRRITAGGLVTTVAGTAGATGSADGTRAAARFNRPSGIAVDGAGNLYVADTVNHTIRKITAAGVVTTLAGTAGAQGSADGTGAAARFFHPVGIAVDSAGNVFVGDTTNRTLRRVSATGGVTTLAGSPGMFGSDDGPGADARFGGLSGLAIDPNGILYVVDDSNHVIRRFAVGSVTTVLGTAGRIGTSDGTGPDARFTFPSGIAVDSSRNLYIVDRSNHTIRRAAAGSMVITLAGRPPLRGSADGTGSAARFDDPEGIAADDAGNVYVADSRNHTIRKITPAGLATTLAGLPGMFDGLDGTGAEARFFAPAGTAVDGAGNIYVADRANDTIRKITPAGVVTTLAGVARASGDTDGTGTVARFHSPTAAAFDGTGNLYIVDQTNATIRKMTPGGVVTTLAGSPGMYGSTDGTGAAARFNLPTGIAVDGGGNLYIADQTNDTIRKVTPDGVVTTLAGSPGMSGSADGTGPAARFARPSSVAIDASGNLYVIDQRNATIRKITPAGVTTTVAGTAGLAGIVLGAEPRFSTLKGLSIAGDSLVVTDTNAVLVLRHAVR